MSSTSLCNGQANGLQMGKGFRVKMTMRPASIALEHR